MGPFQAFVLMRIVKTPHNLPKKPAYHQRQEKIYSRKELVKLQVTGFFLQRGLSQLLHMFRQLLL